MLKKVTFEFTWDAAYAAEIDCMIRNAAYAALLRSYLEESTDEETASHIVKIEDAE